MNFPQVKIPCRARYSNLVEPHSYDGGTPKYSICAFVSKKDTGSVDSIRLACDQAAKAKWGDDIPSDLKSPLRDGDIERPNDPSYKNTYFLNAYSQYSPTVVDRRAHPLNPGAIGNGCYVRIVVMMVPYDYNGTKGISARLVGVQFVDRGDELCGASSAEALFDAIEDDDDLLS